MHPQTLRMYEARGLIEPKRSPKGTRLYSQADVERLRRIQEMTTELGLNLAGVERVLELEEQLERASRRLRGARAARRGQMRDEARAAQLAGGAQPPATSSSASARAASADPVRASRPRTAGRSSASIAPGRRAGRRVIRVASACAASARRSPGWEVASSRRCRCAGDMRSLPAITRISSGCALRRRQHLTHIGSSPRLRFQTDRFTIKTQEAIRPPAGSPRPPQPAGDARAPARGAARAGRRRRRRRCCAKLGADAGAAARASSTPRSTRCRR